MWSQLPQIIAALSVFLGLPWMIFHYITKWKSNATLTREDETLLDELHELARRCDERIGTIERIMNAENPNWRAVTCDPAETGIEDSREPRQTRDTIRRIK
jgi:phage shock protein B